MRNITVAIDDDTYDRAAKVAADRQLSIADLIKGYIEQLAIPEADIERLKEQERELRKQITNFAASDRLSRDELHQR